MWKVLIIWPPCIWVQTRSLDPLEPETCFRSMKENWQMHYDTIRAVRVLGIWVIRAREVLNAPWKVVRIILTREKEKETLNQINHKPALQKIVMSPFARQQLSSFSTSPVCITRKNLIVNYISDSKQSKQANRVSITCHIPWFKNPNCS